MSDFSKRAHRILKDAGPIAVHQAPAPQSRGHATLYVYATGHQACVFEFESGYTSVTTSGTPTNNTADALDQIRAGIGVSED